jgi:1-acyl-sn-glycerol-3-phosphate acyltransferase
MKTFMYFTFWVLIRIHLLLFHRYKVYNRQRLKDAPEGVLFASNHASFLDPMIIGSSFARKVHYLARRSLFETNAFFGWLIDACNAIPVSRKRLDMKTVRRVREVCKNNGAFVIFPEGTRTCDGELQQGQAGIGFFADKIGVPIVPVYLDGTYNAWSRHKKTLRIFTRIRMNIGKPLYVNDMAEGLTGKERYQEIADVIMRSITELKKELHE